MRRAFLILWLVLLTGCRSAPPPEPSLTANRPGPPPLGVVLVANGSGDIQAMSAHLDRVVAETGTPLRVEAFDWSVGYRRYLIDHLDHENHLLQGRRLAAQVLAYRRTCPDMRIYLLGYSSGAAVILAAADTLPPNSVDRIVLLAPSVCTCYDLRPALRSARCGIDAFYSERDRFVLGLGMRVFGTADRGCRVAAGQRGFEPVLECPGDAALYEKLHQHPWSPGVAWTGNTGGHYGSDQLVFLRAYVLPLLAPR